MQGIQRRHEVRIGSARARKAHQILGQQTSN
jgi:hypothetical protein